MIKLENMKVEEGRIPTLRIEVSHDNEKRHYYLVPYRRYGFQVCTSMSGDNAQGIIVGDISAVCEAGGNSYRHEVFASLAYAGFTEWFERTRFVNGEERIRFSFFNRPAGYLQYDSEQEHENHAQIQQWLTDAEIWTGINQG